MKKAAGIAVGIVAAGALATFAVRTWEENRILSFVLSWVAAGLLIHIMAATMPDRPSFAWYAVFLAIRCLALQGVALLLCGLDFSHPILLLASLGVLVAVYFLCLGARNPPDRRLSGPGCSLLLLMVLIVLLLLCIDAVAKGLSLATAWPMEAASALFTLFVLLAPAIYHWHIVEECYYQVHLAPGLRRDLGFDSDTNTLEGTWPVGERYLFFTEIQPGGLMDRAGFRPYDIVLDPRGFTDFWYRLETARGGGPIAITVAHWSDPGPVSARPRRQVLVRVPART